MSRRQSLAEVRRQAELKYLRDTAIDSIQTFSEVYRSRMPYGTEDALDLLAAFHESYERHQGETRTTEKRLLNVRHTKGCEKKFRMALPGTHKLVTGERGITRVQAECPHCGEKMKVRLPEGKVAVPVDGGGRQGGKTGEKGMGSEHAPDRGDVFPDDDLDDLRDDVEDEEEDEDFMSDETEDRGLLPNDVLPRSGPYRPGAGERDSLRTYYKDRPEKVVRLAKKESNPRLRAAARRFLEVLDERRRYNRPVC